MGSNISSETNENLEIEQSQRMANKNSPVSLEAAKNSPVCILKEVLKSVKLDENLKRENNAILHEFLDSFIVEMKRNDELFKILYQRPSFTGSYYIDLRISQPDEFDINLVLKLPFKANDFEITHKLQTPSYVKYRLKDPAKASVEHPRLVSLLFSDGYFIPENVRKWLQSLVDKTMIKYKAPSQCLQVSTRQAGPARTIFLRKRNGGQIDIDLVPVIEATLNLPTTNLDKRLSGKYGNNLQAFLVPKPYSNTKQMPVNQKEAICLWRTHFPDAEKDLTTDIGCVKPIIKLLKLLRDKENWKVLASYYLKTLVMWMILDNPNKDYWKEDKMFDRFLEALQKLSTYIEQQKIPYLFNKKYNLISKINGQQASNIHNRLKYFIRILKENPKNLWKIFQITFASNY